MWIWRISTTTARPWRRRSPRRRWPVSRRFSTWKMVKRESGDSRRWSKWSRSTLDWWGSSQSLYICVWLMLYSSSATTMRWWCAISNCSPTSRAPWPGIIRKRASIRSWTIYPHQRMWASKTIVPLKGLHCNCHNFRDIIAWLYLVPCILN